MFYAVELYKAAEMTMHTYKSTEHTDLYLFLYCASAQTWGYVYPQQDQLQSIFHIYTFNLFEPH